jgi:hypothetical protein
MVVTRHHLLNLSVQTANLERWLRSQRRRWRYVWADFGFRLNLRGLRVVIAS